MNQKPSIFLDKIETNKKHNKTTCYVKNKKTIEDEINTIYQGNEPMYYKKVLIQTDTKTFETRIYEKREQEIITIDHIVIPISNIISIKRIS